MARRKVNPLPEVMVVTTPHPDAAERLRLAFDLLLKAAARAPASPLAAEDGAEIPPTTEAS
jgi:hypothetical protein